MPGKSSYCYDVWGDACNTASRMYSHGIPSKIHITESTMALLIPQYIIEKRGEIQVKGKGLMTTYFLERRRKDGEHCVLDDDPVCSSLLLAHAKAQQGVGVNGERKVAPTPSVGRHHVQVRRDFVRRDNTYLIK